MQISGNGLPMNLSEAMDGRVVHGSKSARVASDQGEAGAASFYPTFGGPKVGAGMGARSSNNPVFKHS